MKKWKLGNFSLTRDRKNMNDKICKWCLFKESDHLGKLDHCKKMLNRIRKRFRIGTRCKRSYCNHKRKEHNGETISSEDLGGGNKSLTIVTKTVCSHVIRLENGEPIFCDCRLYL